MEGQSVSRELTLLGKEEWYCVSYIKSTKDDPRVHIASIARNSENEEIVAVSLKADEVLDLLAWLKEQEPYLQKLKEAHP